MVYAGALNTITIFTAPISGAASGCLLVSMETSRDISELGGNGRLAGTVNVDSSPDYPVWRRVRLFDKRDNRLVREVWSDPATGAYSFDYINAARQYVVISYDHTGVYNAEVLDALVPEPMP